MSKGHVLAVVGAQLGSEGKGAVVNHLAPRYDIHVRVGGPNAGHSFWHQGEKHVQQVVPCGWTNPNAFLILGRGMLINPEVLLQEVGVLQTIDPQIRKRIMIDPLAGFLDPKFHEQEGGTKGEMHQRIGSTGEGVGAARGARMARNADHFQLIGDVAEKYGIEDMMARNTPGLLQHLVSGGKNALLEGTQGSGLSLIHGPWPFVTSADTNAAQMAADVGIPPHLVKKVLMVARTYPIRVAGNSGPLKNETSWDALSKELGKEVIERTTVTKKVRRVGLWDDDLLDSAIVLNGPTSLAITFMDYLNPKDEGVEQYDKLSEVGRNFVEYVERRFGVPVSFLKTADKSAVIERGEV